MEKYILPMALSSLSTNNAMENYCKAIVGLNNTAAPDYAVMYTPNVIPENAISVEEEMENQTNDSPQESNISDEGLELPPTANTIDTDNSEKYTDALPYTNQQIMENDPVMLLPKITIAINDPTHVKNYALDIVETYISKNVRNDTIDLFDDFNGDKKKEFIAAIGNALGIENTQTERKDNMLP